MSIAYAQRSRRINLSKPAGGLCSTSRGGTRFYRTKKNNWKPGTVEKSVGETVFQKRKKEQISYKSWIIHPNIVWNTYYTEIPKRIIAAEIAHLDWCIGQPPHAALRCHLGQPRPWRRTTWDGQQGMFFGRNTWQVWGMDLFCHPKIMHNKCNLDFCLGASEVERILHYRLYRLYVCRKNVLCKI